MLSMPRPRKPYIHREVTRHGKTIWYFRKGMGKRIRLPGVFGSPEFNAAYDAAAMGKEPDKKSTTPQTKLRWLVDRYYESGRFHALRDNTRRNHRLMLEGVCKTGRDLNFRAITAADIKAGIVRREKTPNMAAAYISVMRALFAFAKDSNWLTENPVRDDIKAAAIKTDGYHTWTVEEVEQYQAHHLVGTQARLALDIMLYTGLRRSDAIVFGRQHIRNGVITFRTRKTGAEITLPLLPPLAKSIEAAPTGDLIFLFNSREQAWKNISFGYWFAARVAEAGLPSICTAHGLRKAGATIAANNGATPFELAAMFGWSSVRMAEVYTKKADRARLAERAANKLYPHTTERFGRRTKKAASNNDLEKRD
jgi:integrase